MQKKDFVVRLAGEGGQGMVTAAEALAQAAAQVGYYVQTFSTFPSQIQGGPTWAQARVSANPIYSSGDDLDVLVAFNRESYDAHLSDLTNTGVVIYDSGTFQLPDDGKSLGIPLDELAKSTGNLRAANMVILGALAHLVSWPQEFLTEFVMKRFARGRADDEAIITSNIKALKLGRDRAEASGFTIGQLVPPQMPPYPQVLIKGNDALALGALAGGVEFFVGYPISPATTILVFMERNLMGKGKFVYQASSEIEAINTLVGAGYAGKKAMTSTSGPGLSLMSEGLGMAWMMEIPCVVADIQRGGPATGLPTKTEQSDLQAAIHPAHGDSSLPILAPGSIEECFYAAVTALNWAERYQGPVIILSEHMLSERNENIRKPDLTKIVKESRLIYQGQNGYQRYESRELSPMPLPGGPGAYVANASEHDPMGDTTHLPERHIHMTERRFSKLRLLEDGTYESENASEPIALLPWGGSKGPAREAYDLLLQRGQRLGWYYTMYLNPLPPRLVEELKKKELVIVPELNYQGQFSEMLRGRGIPAMSLTQYVGLPFKVRDLVRRIGEVVHAHRERMVAV